MTSFHKNLLIAGAFLVVIFLMSSPYLFLMPAIDFSEEDRKDTIEEAEEAEIEMPTAHVSAWKTYRSNWFGFEVKYPKEWNAPVVKKAGSADKWEYRYFFRKKELNEGDVYAGFDVAVYDVRKVKRVLDSKEMPPLKNQELATDFSCQTIADHLAMNENFPAEEINIPADDKCFEPAVFYAFAYGQYAYNIVPVNKNEEKRQSAKEEVLANFPEFFSVSASFNLVEIKRTQKTRVPVITAPKPTAKTKAGPGGKRVCAKKGDDPSRSDTHSKKHMDMECCLDPDEYPNPHCYYSESKYGKYLK
jgi:hypothetical protein